MRSQRKNKNNMIQHEVSRGHDMIGAMPMAGVADKGKWHAHFKIERFANDAELKAGRSYKTTEFEHNILVNAGINLMESLLIGGGGTVYSNANAYLGVGDSSTAAAAGQTDLQAATNKLRKAMNATYPTQGSQQVVFQSDFGSSEANFAWEEFATFNDASAGTMLNRKVSAQGTKTSGQTWRLTMTITIS